MNIKDAKYLDLRNVIFIKPDGELVFGEFHGDFAREFFGLRYNLTTEQSLEGEKCYGMYMKYKEQNWSINLVPFLIRFYGFDLHSFYSKTIISTKPLIYKEYFNYYLNGYTLESTSPLVYDDATGRFDYPPFNEPLFEENMQIKEEADMILTRTLKEEIPKFYR